MNLLRYARYFATIVDEGHFGHAADRLGVTQPPLSQGLRRLEEELGVRLLDRGPKGVAVTAAGGELLPTVHALLALEEELREAARALVHTRSGLQIGIAPDVPGPVAASLAAVCSEAVPDEVAIHIASTTAILEGLRRYRLDIAVTLHPAVLGDLAGSDVLRLPRHLLVPEADARRIRAGATLRQLVSRPLAIGPRQDCPPAHDLLVDTLLQHGVRHGTVTAADERVALTMVATGKACTLTADPDLKRPGVRSVPLPWDVLPLRLRIVHRPGHEDAGVTIAAGRIQEILAALEPDHTDGRETP